MSAATADRLLRSQRKRGQSGLSTSRAGTLLKQQIPIRTFEEWKEIRPGFLEADLVAHCGADIEGGYLYTLTRDLRSNRLDGMPPPLASERGAGAGCPDGAHVRSSLFPFWGLIPITAERRINEVMVAYCEQEQITFTRGRPYQKRDQCNALAKKWCDSAPGGRL